MILEERMELKNKHEEHIKQMEQEMGVNS